MTLVPSSAIARPWLRLLGVALLSLVCLSSESLNAKDASNAASSPVSASAPTSSGTLQTSPTSPTLPPLELDLPTVALSAARVGKAYRHVFKASGGQPPYQYTVKGGALPEGLVLDALGQLSGTPMAATVARNYPLTIGVTDALQHQATQNYSLRVLAPSPAKSASAPASAASKPLIPALTPPLKTLPAEHAQALLPAPLRPQVDVYKLQADTLKLLVPTPGPAEEAALMQAAALQNEQDRANGVLVEEPPPEPVAASASNSEAKADADSLPPAPGPMETPQIEQLIQLLTPLLNVEYPNQQLFEAALDAQLCQFTAVLIRDSAAKQGDKAPSKSELAKACPPPDWDARLTQAQAQRARSLAHPAGTTASTSAAASDKTNASGISWQELAPSIMPPELRAWLIESSRKTHALSFDKKIAWDGKGCGCVQDEIQGQIYGFFPDWWATGQPQKIDFSRLTRASVFGVAINDDGSLALPDPTQPGFTDFIQQARVHGTAVDLTLYRNDWQFLKNPDAKERDATIQRIIKQVPGRALGVINRPLSDWRSRLFGLLPGLGGDSHMGDGITLFLDKLPQAEDRVTRDHFDAFYKQLVEALITALRKGPHDYTLNLVISDRELGTPGAFALDNLLDYLRQAENPALLRGRIQADSAQYKTSTNLTLRFIVMLSEPTSDSKKALRAKLDQTSVVQGGDRRILLRKLIPLVSPRSKGGQPFGDDLVYFDDNFGGVAFWPMPIEGVSTPVDFDQNFDAAFLSTSISELKLNVRGWVCEHRWLLRAALNLMLIVGAVCGLALWLNCAWRDRWGRYESLVVLPPLVVGGLLFSFDPALKPLRESNFLIWSLLAIVTAWAVLAMRRTQVEKP